MTRYAYYVDLSICAGCEACTVACQNLNGLSPDLCYTKVHRFETGTFPDMKSTFVTTQCLHCDNPPCADVCPTGATFKTADGPVTVNYAQCINCQYCVTACPYEARVLDTEAATVRKCSLCYDRMSAGLQPACAQTCLTGARIVGDLDDPASPIHEAVAKPGTAKIEGTSFYYRVPEGIPRDVLPADFKAAGITYAWQSIFQPVGQLMLGGVTAAVVLSLLANAANSLRKGEGNDGGH